MMILPSLVIAIIELTQLFRCCIRRLNPDWSPETRSTFLLACDARELIDLGLTLKVKDWDLIGGDDPLGKVFLEGLDLLDGEGDLREFAIVPPKGQED